MVQVVSSQKNKKKGLNLTHYLCASAITRKCYITEFISYYTWYFDMWVFVITEYEVENEFWKPAVSGPAKAISESYWSATLSITADLLWWNRAAEIISHYLNPAFKHNVQRSNYFTSKKIQMRQLAFVQHMQWMSHRCWSADMVKVPGIRGCEGQDVLVESMMSVTPSSSRDTKRQQVLGTSLALIDLSPQWLI